MSDTTDILEKFKIGLDPYVKPREQVNYIRRVLALHLGTATGNGPAKHPLSIIDSNVEVDIPSDVSGIFKEYVEALYKNVAARRQLDSFLQSDLTQTPEPRKPQLTSAEILEERLCHLRLQRKLKSLHACSQSLDLLIEKPAAASEFLDVKHILEGTPRLPSVPSEVIDGLVVEQGSSRSDLDERVHQLEKTVLRAKLQLRQEEESLREAKGRSKSKHEVVSNGARLQALNATRTELISWIETELGKASSEDTTEGAGSHDQQIADASKATPEAIDARLGDVSAKYTEYTALRRRVLELGSHKSQPMSLALPQPALSNSDALSPPMKIDHLLSPCLEQLITVSAKQKGIIGQKSFVNTALAKQNQDTCLMLGRLAEESHLLPSFPMKDSLRRRSGIQHEIATRTSEQPDIAERIKPWVFAADASKITTLETVAETVEGGQVALENSMATLQEIDMLLGQEDDEASENLTTEDSSEGGVRLASTSSIHKVETGKEIDIWAGLKGNLGLLGQGGLV